MRAKNTPWRLNPASIPRQSVLFSSQGFSAIQHVAPMATFSACSTILVVSTPTRAFTNASTRKRQAALAGRLKCLGTGLQSPRKCRSWLEDQFYALAGDLLALRSSVQREVASFPGFRASTRQELYRRLHRARDYIDSCYAEKMSVERIARVACLSPYHFHRTFQSAFGETPMRRLQERRLRAACRLLATTDRPVTLIGLEVGFDSLGSFSWLFQRRIGVSPRAYRAAAKLRKTQG